jgi:hypothetical protein
MSDEVKRDARRDLRTSVAVMRVLLLWYKGIPKR